ncbi:hypothetical protein SEA_DAUDAU_60 [Streptomyces phage Daudau]|uniref:Uncharacterized protein n=1 Tax=Streptomyces phage Daudau TaxID=2041206 RepID=A0A291LHE0_9CAUD|nr:hypothetical protein KGG88_gp60 [Streptomyces phage Daudau]ATI18761.1 hypothetical protein SEA_DAUDAU_60 [Streptomyces phage Daudau]
MADERSQAVRYVKVDIEGKFIGSDVTVYAPLEDGVEYTPDEIEDIAQDLVNQEYTWGHDVVDESEVPEDERQ